MGSLYGNFKTIDDSCLSNLLVAIEQETISVKPSPIKPVSAVLDQNQASKVDEISTKAPSVTSLCLDSNIQNAENAEQNDTGTASSTPMEKHTLGSLVDVCLTCGLTGAQDEAGLEQVQLGPRVSFDDVQVQQCARKRKCELQIPPSNIRKQKFPKQLGGETQSSTVQAIKQWRRVEEIPNDMISSLYKSAFGNFVSDMSDWADTQNGYRAYSDVQIEFGVSSSQNIRKYMEDRYICVPHINLSSSPSLYNGTQSIDNSCAYAAVFDGHNGVHAADIGIHSIYESITSKIFASEFGVSNGCEFGRDLDFVSSVIKQSFQEVDDMIVDLAVQNDWTSGSTGLLAFLIGRQIYVANCGDSRAVLCNAGTAIRITTDHKPNVPKEQERIQKNGGQVTCQTNRIYRVVVQPSSNITSKLAVSRALGDIWFKQPNKIVECVPDVYHRQIEDGDQFLILASDGLWDTISDQRAVSIIKSVLFNQSLELSLQERLDLAAQECQSCARKAGSTDNITVVVMFFKRD